MKSKSSKILLWIAFLAYLLVTFHLIIGKGWGGFTYLSQCYASWDIWKQEIGWNLNLLPFRFLFDTQGYTPITWCKNVIGNIVLFIPMGFFFLCLFPPIRTWRFRKYVFTMVFLIIGIELLQLFLMCGSCDIDDLILNLCGACLGFVVTKQAGKSKAIFSEKRQKET